MQVRFLTVIKGPIGKMPDFPYGSRLFGGESGIRTYGTVTRLVSRLDKVAAAVAAKRSSRQEIIRRIMGHENPEDVLDHMIASGEITEHQRGDVRFIRRVIVAPVWDTDANGAPRLVGRRNVHTGKIERVED
jgi:hypothetical protein